MRETFLALCNLWSFLSYCQWVGNYTKAVDTAKQIDEIAKNHKVLNFFARHLWKLNLTDEFKRKVVDMVAEMAERKEE